MTPCYACGALFSIGERWQDALTVMDVKFACEPCGAKGHQRFVRVDAHSVRWCGDLAGITCTGVHF